MWEKSHAYAAIKSVTVVLYPSVAVNLHNIGSSTKAMAISQRKCVLRREEISEAQSN